MWQSYQPVEFILNAVFQHPTKSNFIFGATDLELLGEL